MAALPCRFLRLLPALALALLAGCGVRLRDEGLLDRCADLMQQAFPGGEIKVTKAEQVTQQTQSIATFVAAVAGRRERLPEGSPLQRDVAVECSFDDRILTGFRWTKGPLR